MSMIGKTVHYAELGNLTKYKSGMVSEEYILVNHSDPSEKVHMLVLENGKEIKMDQAYLKTVAPQSPLPNVQ